MKNMTSTLTAIFLLTSLTTAQNYSLSFDGNDDYVTIPHSSSFNNNTISISVWVYLDTAPSSSESYLLFKGTDTGSPYTDRYWGLRLSGGSNMHVDGEFVISGSYYIISSNSVSLDTGNWHHILLTYDGSEIKLIIDSIEVNSLSASGTLSSGSDNVILAYMPPVGYPFSGYLDAVSIWDRAISSSEINGLLDTELTGSEDDLVGYWNFNEGSGSTLTDQTSNGNDGTISGATWSTDVPPTPGDVSSDDVLIEEITLLATEYQALESSVLSDGTEYYLKVTGTYGYGGWSSPECVDGSFAYCGHSEGIIHVRVWTWNGLNTQLPYPDEYNSDHVYYFYFTGDGTAEEFGFVDNGGYGDNSGSLTIQIWQRPEETTTATSEFLTEVEHPNEARSFVNNIIQYNDEFLVSLGDRRIKRLDSDGNIVDLFVQLDGTGDLTTIIPFGEYIVAHGSAAGYNINNYIIDGSSGSYSTQNLSASSGYSSAGDIIGINGDIYMAWATNCCGMGQTWDTELKKLSGVTTDVVWNTEICFSCDQSLGSGSAGLDYPRDLEISGDNLIVVGEKVTNPNTPNPYIVSVDLNGNINWTFTEEDYVGLYKKSIETYDSGILAAGDGNGFFISRFNATGEKVWRIEINSIPEDAILTDLIEYDTYALLYGVSSEGVHVVLVDQTSGELFLENQYATSNVPLVYNAQTQSQIIEIDDGKFIAVYNHGEWWDNTNFSVVTFDLNVQQDEEPTQNHSLSFDGVDDYVEILNSTSLSLDGVSAFSVQIWIKNSEIWTSPRWSYILSKSDQTGGWGFSGGYIIRSGADGGAPFGYNGILETSAGEHGFSSSGTITANWEQVIVVYNGSDVKFYRDGSLSNTNMGISGTLSDYVGNMYFGSANNGSTHFYEGLLDDIAIWNSELSLSEITALYNSGNGLNASSNSGNYTSSANLQSYWNFNEGTGTTASDATSNSNDGTIYGATWSTDVPFSGTTTTSALTWSVRAKASLSTYNDNDNYLGVASSATNTFDANYDVLEPPASPGSSVSLYFPHDEWDYLLGDNFSTDARPEITLTDTMQVWDFEVLSTDAGEATLTFAFTDVPDVPVILENTATGARETLTNNATYTFTVVADSAHPFRVSIGDTTSPSLTLGSSCSGPAILISDSTHSLGWTSTDGFEVDSVLVSFSSDSGTTYTLQAALGTVNSYNWTVPDTTIIYEGILKIKAMDYAGNETESESNYIFAVVGDSLTTPVTAGWTLWGAPINPANDSMSVNLDDDFSDYWDTFDYVDNGYTYDGILLEGEGYWLGAAQSATIDVLGTPIISDFTMSLSQGWELISNPLVLDISVDSLTFTKDDETKVYSEAVTAGWVNSIYEYSNTGYVVPRAISPWSGYWIAVLETGVEMTSPIHRHVSSDGSRSRDEGWMINFNAEVDGANDEMMMVGYAETATDGFDAEHDAVNPPHPPGPVYISLFTAHPEWDYLLGDQFTKDIRAEVPANGYQEWILSMESSESEAQISWTFENVPDEYDIGYSINDGIYFDDMRSVSTTTLSVSSEMIVRVGTQVLSIDAEPIPEVYALRQNYPNPFNPFTTLRYDLPEEALVNITIYDMMGRVVKTMVNSQQNAGYKSIQWNATTDEGKPVSAGLYLYTIQAGEFRQTKKMVLLK